MTAGSHGASTNTAFRVPPDVAWVEVQSDQTLEAVAARVPLGPPVAMQGSSALVWFAALECEDDDAIVSSVAEVTGERPETVREPVLAFLGELVAQGLLERGQPLTPSASRDNR